MRHHVGWLEIGSSSWSAGLTYRSACVTWCASGHAPGTYSRLKVPRLYSVMATTSTVPVMARFRILRFFLPGSESTVIHSPGLCQPRTLATKAIVEIAARKVLLFFTRQQIVCKAKSMRMFICRRETRNGSLWACKCCGGVTVSRKQKLLKKRQSVFRYWLCSSRTPLILPLI